MGRIEKKIPFRVSVWEQILIYRLRQIHKKKPNEFFVSIHFTGNRVTLHIAEQPESFMVHGRADLTKNS